MSDGLWLDPMNDNETHFKEYDLTEREARSFLAFFREECGLPAKAWVATHFEKNFTSYAETSL